MNPEVQKKRPNDVIFSQILLQIGREGIQYELMKGERGLRGPPGMTVRGPPGRIMLS